MPEEWEECIKAYIAKGLSKEEAHKRCGKLRKGHTEAKHSEEVDMSEEIDLGIQKFTITFTHEPDDLEKAFQSELARIQKETEPDE